MKLDESTAAPLQKKDRNFRATFQAYRQRKLIVKITANWDCFGRKVGYKRQIQTINFNLNIQDNIVKDNLKLYSKGGTKSLSNKSQESLKSFQSSPSQVSSQAKSPKVSV